ncbi:hypothetical protein ACO0LV_11780 [Pseudactinotalea sp. Z1739]|uniref:hypothetical protein n=1 Tax=Pseudactinotalea sp. Z1739 TaxID=3413028 RepID=UPI003C7AD12A
MNVRSRAAVLIHDDTGGVHPVADQLARGSDPNLVAPGMAAFLAFLALALAVIALGWSLTRQVRRSEYRNAQRRAAAAQQRPGPAGAGAASVGDVGADSPDPGDRRPGGDDDASPGAPATSPPADTPADGGSEARP